MDTTIDQTQIDALLADWNNPDLHPRDFREKWQPKYGDHSVFDYCEANGLLDVNPTVLE